MLKLVLILQVIGIACFLALAVHDANARDYGHAAVDFTAAFLSVMAGRR
jgi:hypothetical protein